MVENILEDMKSRFLSKRNQTIVILSQLIPKYIVDTNDKMIDTLVEAIITYKFDDDSDDILKPFEESQIKSEIELWKEKWKNVKTKGT